MRTKIFQKIYLSLLVLIALVVIIAAPQIFTGGVTIGGQTVIGSVAAQGGITPSTINTTVTNPNVTNDPNDHLAWLLNVTTDGTTTNPAFTTESGLREIFSASMGQALYGSGTNAKKTFTPVQLVGNFAGAGQKVMMYLPMTCWSMSDCGLYSENVTFSGGPVAGDEAQGMTVIGYLQQQGALTRTTITSVAKSSCNTTLTQNVTANKNAQTVTVASTVGCNVNDWVTFGKEVATASANSVSAKITAVNPGVSITAVIPANYANTISVLGATVLGVASTTNFGQMRVLVDRSGTTYNTGTIATISGGAFTGAGTSWSSGMVGGDGINPGCISLTNDQYTGSPFGAGAAALNSYYQITGVNSGTSLGIYSTSVAGDASYHGNGVGTGGYVIYPCSTVQYLPGGNSIVLESNSFTWTIGDTVELAICPYPDVTGYQYQTSVYTPGGIRRAWLNVTNNGPTAYTTGINFVGNGTNTGWTTGANFSNITVGVVSDGATSGNAFVARGTVATPIQCNTFTGSNEGGGWAYPLQSGYCYDVTAQKLYINQNDAHVITLSNGYVQPRMPTSCAGQPSGTIWNNSNVVNVCP